MGIFKRHTDTSHPVKLNEFTIMKKTTTLVLTTIGLSLLLGGCGMFGKKNKALPPKPLSNFTPAANAKVLWQTSTGNYSKKQYVKIHPAISGNTIFVAGGSSASAIDKNSGKIRWKTPVADSVTAGVNIGENSVFIGTLNGNAISLDQATGKPHWAQSLSSEVAAVSEAKGGMVVFRTIDGKVHGLSTATGEILWQKSRKTPILSLRGTSVPIVTGNKVIVGFDNGKLTAFDMQAGNAIWEAILGVPRGRTELDRVVDIDGKIKLVGSKIYAASYNGQIAAINAGNGSVFWSTGYSTDTGVDANTNSVYTTSAKGDVFKLAASNGSPQWKIDNLERRHPTAPSIVGSRIVVGDYAGYLHIFDTTSGKTVARKRGDSSGYTVSPVVEGNMIYAFGKSGVLTAISLQ